MHTHYTFPLLLSLGLVAACTEPPPPRSVGQFVDNPIMLEAAVVRCSENRDRTRYDAECVNARQAVQQIEAKEEAIRRVDFDARSDRKRQALRRAQQAAAEARRRAADSERLRKEAEYLAQFGVALPREDRSSNGGPGNTGNTPTALIPTREVEPQENPAAYDDVVPATDGGNAPAAVAEPVEEEVVPDLKSIRDELQRRNEDSRN